MRIAIFGNSGSGKSTLARRLADEHGLPLLELDMIVWEPNKIAVERKREDAVADLDRFLAGHGGWVVEGCDGYLIAHVLPHCTEVLFLNPGLEACRRNNLARRWEAHKYDSPEAQNSMLENLLAWVEAYYTRTDDRSLARHRSLFDAHAGRKTEVGPKHGGETVSRYVDSTEQLVVELLVRDLARSLAFYQSLGFRLISEKDGFAAVGWEDHRLFLDQREGLPEPPAVPVMNVRVMVPDVDRVWRLATERGARVVAPIEDRSYGLRVFTIADPDGFGVRFATRLPPVASTTG